MENFEFFTPTRMISGKNAHQQVGEIVREYGFKKVLTYFGGTNARKLGLLGTVIGVLGAEGIQYVTLGGTQANPTPTKAKEGIELCLREGADLVLAVGGGSMIDSAKCVADDAGNLDADVWTCFCREVMPARAPPVDIILTFSASGSEMGASCVVTNEENGFKRGFNSMTHRPPLSICNPELICTVSKYQTTCDTVDIMMHTPERYFGRTRDTELADHIAGALLKSMVEADRIADKEPDSYEARAALIQGDGLSHNELTGVGRDLFMQVHQLEHEFSGMCPSIAHEAGLATLWPSWARFMCPGDMNRFARYMVRVWNIDMDFGCPMNMALTEIRATGDFYKSLGVPSLLEEFGVKEEHLGEMAEKCTSMGKRTLPGIRELGKKEMMEIYRTAVGK